MNFEYNILNLLSTVKTGTVLTAYYTYLADGTKLRVADASGNGYYYLGSLIYSRSSAGIVLEGAMTASGRILVAGGSRVGSGIRYFLTDHLGSIRTIVDETGAVKERNDYYPFGTRYSQATSAVETTNRLKYNGKEDQTTGNLGFLDYGARMYDTELGRWFTVDPMAEAYYSLSSYNYCANSPILFIDPDGQAMDWYKNRTGEMKYDPTIHSAKDMQKMEGTYLGKTYTEGNTYYSLFGHIMNLQNWEGRLYQKIDEMLIKSANFSKQMENYNYKLKNGKIDFYEEPPTSPSLNFNIGLNLKSNKYTGYENNIYLFNYEGARGYYFVLENESMVASFTWGNDQKSINKTISGQGLKSGYNVSFYSKRFPKQDVVTLVFPILENKNKFYKKWKSEFQLQK